MRRIPTLSGALLAAAIVLAGTGCSYLKSRDHLNQGIASFRGAKRCSKDRPWQCWWTTA